MTEIKKRELYEGSGPITGIPAEEKAVWLLPDTKIKKEANTVYFPGCMTAYRSPAVAWATARILNNLGIEFSIMGEEQHCCGDPLIMVGQLFLAREMAKYNWEHLKDKKVITSCAGCYRTFKQEYPVLMGEECNIDAVHIVDLLADTIHEGKVKYTGKVNGKVIYHDPYGLGMEPKAYDQPRQILRSIPGIELVELKENREKTWCCGGGIKGANSGLSVEISKDEVREALAAGVKTIVSACPSCKINISDAVKALGADMKVIDITELVARAGISLT